MADGLKHVVNTGRSWKDRIDEAVSEARDDYAEKQAEQRFLDALAPKDEPAASVAVIALEPEPPTVSEPEQVSDGVEICADFSQIIAKFYQVNEKLPPTTAGDHQRRRHQGRQQMRQATDEVGLTPPDASKLIFRFALSRIEWGETDERQVALTPDFTIPAEFRVPGGNWRVELFDSNDTLPFYFESYRIEAPGPVDLLQLEPLDGFEVERLMQEPEPPPPPPAPVFLRTARTPGDPASRLPFAIGKLDEDIVTPKSWAWVAFRLPHTQIVGRVTTSVETQYETDVVRLILFDGTGNRVLATTLRRGQAEFDEVRLEPGDYALCFQAPSLRGRGSYKNSLAGVFSTQNPKLDELIQDSQPNTGAPQFKLHAS